MRLDEAGIIDFWWRQTIADPTPCLAKNPNLGITSSNGKRNNQEDNRKRITIQGLSGAFIVLFTGYILATLALIIERSIGRMKRQMLLNTIQ